MFPDGIDGLNLLHAKTGDDRYVVALRQLRRSNNNDNSNSNAGHIRRANAEIIGHHTYVSSRA
jgi:hypothetical protein